VISIDTGEQPGIGLFIFKGEAGHLRDIPLQPNSEGSPEWVPVSQVDSLSLVEDLPLLLPRVVQADREEQPFFALYRYGDQGQLVVEFN
jgi:hypothetical protein